MKVCFLPYILALKFWTDEIGPQCRFWPKADPIFLEFDQFGTPALPPKAAIRLIWGKRAANDPKRSLDF